MAEVGAEDLPYGRTLMMMIVFLGDDVFLGFYLGVFFVWSTRVVTVVFNGAS